MAKDVSSAGGQAIGITYDHNIRCGFVCLSFLLVRKQINVFP